MWKHNALDNVFVLNSDSDAQDCELAWERLSGLKGIWGFGKMGTGTFGNLGISRFAEGFVKDTWRRERDNVG